MVIDLTPAVVTCIVVVVSAAFAGGFYMGDQRYFKRSEANDLEKAIIALTESVKGFTDTKDGLRRVHERIDEISKVLSELVGQFKGAGR